MSAYNDLSRNLDSNVLVADFVRDKIRGIVKDSEKAEILTPTSVIGCKRLCLDTDYFDTFNRPNVHVVDIVAQIDPAACERCVAELRGVRERGGRLFILGVGGSAANASHAVNDFRKIAGMECYAPGPKPSRM